MVTSMVSAVLSEGHPWPNHGDVHERFQSTIYSTPALSARCRGVLRQCLHKHICPKLPAKTIHDAGSHNQLDVAGSVARTSRAVASDNFPPRPSTKQAVQFCRDFASLQVRLRAGRGCRQWTCGQLFVCMYDIAFEYLADPSQAARMPSQVKPETSKSAMSTPQQATVNSHSARHDVCSPASKNNMASFRREPPSCHPVISQSVLHATEAVTPPSRRTRLAASATPRPTTIAKFDTLLCMRTSSMTTLPCCTAHRHSHCTPPTFRDQRDLPRSRRPSHRPIVRLLCPSRGACNEHAPTCAVLPSRTH